MEAAHSFRLQQKNMLNAGSKKNTSVIKEKPVKAIVWVAKTFPPWQTTVLETMKELYLVSVHRGRNFIKHSLNYYVKNEL